MSPSNVALPLKMNLAIPQGLLVREGFGDGGGSRCGEIGVTVADTGSAHVGAGALALGLATCWLSR
jgi:hypothetical protein